MSLLHPRPARARGHTLRCQLRCQLRGQLRSQGSRRLGCQKTPHITHKPLHLIASARVLRVRAQPTVQRRLAVGIEAIAAASDPKRCLHIPSILRLHKGLKRLLILLLLILIFFWLVGQRL